MLKTRLITAFIFTSIVIYILSFAPMCLFAVFFAGLASIAIALAGTEFAAMRWNIMDGPCYVEQARPKLKFKHFLIGCSYGLHIFLFYICNLVFKENMERVILISIAWVFLCLFISAALIYRTAIDMHTASNKLLNVIAGFIYLSLPTICLVKFSTMHFEGSLRSAQLYFSLATVLLGDTGAFFIGTKFGKHKLIPKVSPKKSLEGALGGLAVSGIAAVVFAYFFHLPFPWWFCLLVGICTGIAGQIGDLMESAFKRAGGFKDSGNLLPGHGGFLDRIDSLILGIPVTYIFFSLYL
ncbi:MAG: phosphatidate cytidylyltransferase [Bdellovibrionota bacterium]